MIILQDDPFHSFDAWYPKAMTRGADGWTINDDRPSVYDVTIELPVVAGSVASTGRLMEESRESDHGTRIVRLTASDVRGFTIYASPQWKTHRRSVGGVDLRIHIPSAAEKWAVPVFDASADVIDFFQKEYGPFPSDHLEIACLGTLDGPSHGSSATCNGITIWLNSRFSENYRFHVAHEIAHQYFGSLVGLHRNEIAWAPIGLGMMMDHHYATSKGLSDTTTRDTIKWFYFEAIRRGYDTSLAIPVDKAMRDDLRWNMPLMHGKAFEVCRMLEHLIGEEKFNSVVRRALRERKGGLLGGSDLIDYCEDAGGESLDWFVADWIAGNATLDYSVTDVRQDGDTWKVTISKVGDAAFPVTVEVETDRGEKHRSRIDRTQTANQLTFDTDDSLKRVVVDPDGILSRR